MLPYMADTDKKNNPLSELPYPTLPYKGVVGFLLDVSGSMRGALEAGRAEEPAVYGRILGGKGPKHKNWKSENRKI